MNQKESNRPPALPPPLQGRLNFFQRLMLDWNELHPYNAVHGVQISAPLDPARLQSAVRDTLEFHGLTGLTLNRKRGTFQFAGGPASDTIKRIDAPENPPEMLRAEIEWQLNTGFNFRAEFQPFRFFVVAEESAFTLGLVYFHAVADAVVIVHLLRDIYETYLGRDAALPRQRFSLPPTGGQFNLLRFAKNLAAFPARLRQLGRCLRAGYRDVSDGTNRFEHFSLTAETLRNLSATAKIWGVTVNDLFITMLLRCCGTGAPERLQSPRRRELAIGCIVNTRGELGLMDPPAFGLFLGSFVVTHEVPDGLSLQALAKDVRRQTHALKQRKDYVGTSPEMFLGRSLLSFFSTDYRKKLYQKHYPLRGGVTNMNLNSVWPATPGESPVNYFRGVSTGPITPLVLSVTTARDRINLGLTFRAAAFAADEIEQIKNDFIKMLAGLKS